MRVVNHTVQSLLSDSTALILETGDSWFQGQRMRLPQGCNYEFQMQYGSIGWYARPPPISLRFSPANALTPPMLITSCV